MQKKNNMSMLKIGVAFLLLGLITLLSFFVLNKVQFIRTVAQIKTAINPKNTYNKVPQKDFKIEELGFTISYPSELDVHDKGQSVQYYRFVRFEERENSSYKGFALGIQEASLSAELERIKRDFERQGDGMLVDQQKTKIGRHDTVVLNYKPKKESADLEPRSVALIEHDKYVYSISSLPEDLNSIVSAIKFEN